MLPKITAAPPAPAAEEGLPAFLVAELEAGASRGAARKEARRARRRKRWSTLKAALKAAKALEPIEREAVRAAALELLSPSQRAGLAWGQESSAQAYMRAVARVLAGRAA